MAGAITFVWGDITRQEVDAIVNAANSSLMGGGGVDGAIHRAGGPSILEECREIRDRQGGCPPGEAVVTGAGNLPARWVIHTVGPIWRGGHQGEAATLASCYKASLVLAAEQGAATVAFPSISTGAYGYPVEEAAGVAVTAVREALHGLDFDEIRFVLFAEADLEVYRDAYRRSAD
jgi:O-acetyl-ADP-ribose deacetylase (regulator of RNase III)